MARAKSERARSKTLAIDDLTQSIEQLQAFIPKLEDLGREGFPYLEGALARTELQLRECIKRAFGEKSPEFQSHRQLKLALSSPAEKKQTLTLLRGLIASLEDKKLELQGIKPPSPQEPAAPSSRPQLALVSPVVPAAHVSVTSVISTSPPTGSTLHLVPSAEQVPVQAPAPVDAPRPAPPAPPVAETVPPKSAPSPAQSIPPRTPIEPISSLFRTQETKPLPAQSEQTSPASTTSAPASAAPAVAAVTPVVVAAAASPAPVVEPASETQAAPPLGTASPPVPTAPNVAAQTPATPPVAFSTTQEVPVAAPQSVPAPSPAPPANASDPDVDPLALTKLICQRFHGVARQLRLRGEYRSTLTVEDELDVQDLLHALLRQHFDDIGTDEWTPPYTSGAPRTTFLLDHDRLAIVVKKTRTGLSRKDLTDQVRADAERYRARGRCTHLVCFVYDPEGRVGNPRGLESELTNRSEHFMVDVVVAPK